MKRLLLVLALVLFVPMQAPAANLTQHNTWFCKAVGNLDQQQIIFITRPWDDDFPNHYKQREASFTEHVEKLTKGFFVPSFKTKCRDYVTRERGIKHQRLEIETAKEYKFRVVELNWRWNQNVFEKEN